MTFSERAVKACISAMNNRRVSERHIRDVLRYPDQNVDVSGIEPFLKDGDPMVRLMAARILSERGNIDLVVEAALMEERRSVLIGMLKSLRSRGGLDRLAVLLNDTDTIIKEEAISMFKESDNIDCLMLLMFDPNTSLVERAKRYINEQRAKESPNT